MIRYIAQRLLHAIPVLFGVSLITFMLTYLLPADPARMYAGPNATIATVNSIRHQLGLDRPFYEQYLFYIGRVLTGDLGFSYKLQMPVGDAILARFPYTLQLTAGGIFFELLLGLPIGLISALRQGTWIDRLAMLFVFFALAAPPFWLGLMLLYFAAFKAGLFPIGGTGTIWHLVLPAFAAGMGGAAWYARLMRSSALDVIRADYVRTARAKGLRESSVVLRHILRNAILPIITLVGLDIPWFLSGVVLIEAVFAWPGLGKLAVDAVRNVDVPLILGTVLFTALIVVASNIVTDLLYAFVDPRIRYGE
jgi:ABC-type dipeptide/oligopeptide/nickel transport system permease component